MVMVPFFLYPEGICFAASKPGPWIQLAANIAGVVSIILWAGTHSFVIFGGLKYFNLLRIVTEDEFLGVDMIKHGESAYPANAWKELQYSRSTQTLPIMARQYETTKRELKEPHSARRVAPYNGGVDNMAMEKID